MQKELAKRRTQAERRSESWKGLVQAAVAVISQQGVSAATFQAIGDHAGYHRSLVTQRFGAKRGLVDAVIDYLERRKERRAQESGVDELPGLEAFLAYTDVYMRDLAADPEMRAHFMLLSSAVADLSDLRAPFAASHKRTVHRLAKLLERGQADGTIRPEFDPKTVALMIGTLRLGMAIQMLVDPTMSVRSLRSTVLGVLRRTFASGQD
jgi:AcrR family transcriptional regulator